MNSEAPGPRKRLGGLRLLAISGTVLWTTTTRELPPASHGIEGNARNQRHYLSHDVMRVTLGRMNRLGLLGYVASGAILFLIIGFLASLDFSEKVGHALRHQAWPLIGLPMQIAGILAGIMVAVSARLGLLAAGLLILAVCLYSPGATGALTSWRSRLSHYLFLRGYRGAH